MNYSMVKSLILKDWYLQRWAILASLVAGAVTLVIIGTGGKIAFFLGLILLITIIVAIGAQLAVSTVVQERKDKTLPFVMSLPISYREYTASKILGNFLIFLVPWLSLVVGCFVLIAFTPGMPHGLVPYVAIMATEILFTTCLIAAVAIMTESQGWAIGAIMVGNIALNGVGYYVAHIDSIAKGMDSPSLQWSAAATGILLLELAMIALLLGATFFMQSRKRDFI